MLDYDIIGAIKIKDGLFLGDEYAAQDLEFIVTNKVTRIINCAAKQIPNHWEAVEVQYLSYGWLETDQQIIFDNRDEVVNTTFNLIEETLENAESILVHSIRGQNRSVCIIAAYLMKKFKWTLYKTLEFLHSRRQDLEIKASFFNQLLNLENRLARQGQGAKSYNWKELSGERNIDNEELLLTNTFLNAKIGQEDQNNPDDEDQNNENSNIKDKVKNQKNKKDSDDIAEEPFDLKKPDEIEDFDLNSFDGDSDQEEKEEKNKKKEDNLGNESKNRKSSFITDDATTAGEKEDSGKGEKTNDKKQQSSNKIRKIVWTDEDGNKSLCSLEIPPYEQCQFKRKSAVNKQSFYRSILKGSNNIFQMKGLNKNESKDQDKNEISSILNNTNQNASINGISQSGGSGVFRKLSNMKATLRTKKPEDAQQEKKVIMQKITNSQKELPPPTDPLLQKSQSFTNINDDSKIQNSLSIIANKQLKEVMAKYDNPIQQDNENKLEDIDSNPQLPGQGVKDKRRKITRKEFQQLMQQDNNNNSNSNLNKPSYGNSNSYNQEKLALTGDSIGNPVLKPKPLLGNTMGGSKGFDQIDDEYGFGFSKSTTNGFFNNNLLNISNFPNTTNTIGTSNNKDFGMSLSTKNFFNNQNIYPSSTGNNFNSNNPPKFSIKNSFKSTQKIYSNSIVKPQTNNFIMNQNRNTPEIGFQIQKLGSRVYSDDKKFSRAAKVYSRPSTAPLKQNPYQRMLIGGNSIKPASSSQAALQLYSNQQPSSQTQQQQLQQQQLPLSQFPTNIPPSRQASQSRGNMEENNKKSLRSNSAGQQSFPIKNHQFGFFQSHKPRWKF